MRRSMTLVAAVVMVLGLVAGPAAAHVNDNVVGADDRREQRQGGTPFEGFVGPVESFIGSESYVTAHSGMECGALRSPNMTALGPIENGGVGFDDRFVCPSAP